MTKEIDYLKKYGNHLTFENDLKRLENGEPVQYIVGHVNFYGYEFEVNPHVLIPRFETEGLVFKTLELLKDFKKDLKIADLGTGSGCIAITLKLEIENALVDAVDISSNALEVAFKNASKLNALVNFYEGDMLKPLNGKYDLIISNPPYIAYDEEIMDIVKNNEPKSALYASNNGLFYYEEILKNVRPYLNSHFLIAFEIGSTQKDKIFALIQKYLPECDYFCEPDLAGFDRYIFVRK